MGGWSLEYAVAADDKEALAFANRSFPWAREQGSPLVGFFPSNASKPYYQESESCEVADMIALAIKLSRAGAGDYWDDVDRWVRNQFAENQLLRAEWVDEVPKPGSRHKPLFNETAERVAERNVGAFAGWPGVNDWVLRKGIMHCCTGNATRALYYILGNHAAIRGRNTECESVA